MQYSDPQPPPQQQQKTRFCRFIKSGKLAPKAAKAIEEALDAYLNESEFLSEFEEQMTQLNIAQLQFMGKNIQDKIIGT